MAEKTASQQLRKALVDRGYRLMARRYVQHPHHRQLDTYFHPKQCQHLMLEILYEEEERSELGCALWQELAADTNDIAATIAAIP